MHVITSDPRVASAQIVNLTNALSLSLLQLPEQFNDESLFITIAGLSYRGKLRSLSLLKTLPIEIYLGDFRSNRFIPLDNPNKTLNIVRAQKEQFHELYEPHIKALSNMIAYNSSTGNYNVRFLRI